MISVEKLCLQQGAFSLSDISFEVPTGQYAALMGKTGSGKTTILEAICGLRKPVSGRIRLNRRDVTLLKPAERGIGYVPQDGALFATMSVRDHLQFALVIRNWPRKRIQTRVDELVALLGIGHLLKRRPARLSGGEKQRVALGRALASYPAVLCLDEPLTALDDQTLHAMHELLDRVRDTGVTTLHITHNRAEAERLAHRILRLGDSGIVQEVLPRASGIAAKTAGPSGTMNDSHDSSSSQIQPRSPRQEAGSETNGTEVNS